MYRLQWSINGPWLLKTQQNNYTVLGHVNFDSIHSEGGYGTFQLILKLTTTWVIAFISGIYDFKDTTYS